MNISFKVVWSTCQSSWVVVAETIKARGKKSTPNGCRNKMLSCPMKLTPLFLAIFFPLTSFAESLKDPILRSGSVSINLTNPHKPTLTQTTDKAIIDWREFSVGKSSVVKFQHPNTKSITLNRVTGNNKSIINGSITANGQVWILNSNGLLIGKSGKINAHGFMATTQSITNQNFIDGKYNFNSTNNNPGNLSNYGKIQVQNGYALLVGKSVINKGAITAKLGHIVIGNAKTFTIDIVGDNLLSFAVKETFNADDALPEVTNDGEISSLNGTVFLSTKKTKELIKNVVNSSGTIEANSVKINGNKVVFSNTEKPISVKSSFEFVRDFMNEGGHEHTDDGEEEDRAASEAAAAEAAAAEAAARVAEQDRLAHEAMLAEVAAAEEARLAAEARANQDVVNNNVVDNTANEQVNNVVKNNVVDNTANEQVNNVVNNNIFDNTANEQVNNVVGNNVVDNNANDQVNNFEVNHGHAVSDAEVALITQTASEEISVAKDSEAIADNFYPTEHDHINIYEPASVVFDSAMIEKEIITSEEVFASNPELFSESFPNIQNTGEVFDPNVFFAENASNHTNDEFDPEVHQQEYNNADFFTAINNAGLEPDEITTTFKQFNDSDRFIESANLANELGFELNEVADVMGKIDEGTFDQAANLAREYEEIDSSEFFEMAAKTDITTLNNIAAYATEGQSIVEIFDEAVDEAFDSVRSLGAIEPPPMEIVSIKPPAGNDFGGEFGDLADFESPPPGDFGDAPSITDLGDASPSGDFGGAPPPGDFGSARPPGDFGEIPTGGFDDGPPQLMDMEFTSDAPPTAADIAAIEKKFGDDAGFGDFDEIPTESSPPPGEFVDGPSPDSPLNETPSAENSANDSPLAESGNDDVAPPDESPLAESGNDDVVASDDGPLADTSPGETPNESPAESTAENSVIDGPSPVSEDSPSEVAAAPTPPPSISADAPPPPPPPIAPPPPSPVPVEKSPTPVDTADAGDKTLASVSQPTPPKPAQQSQAPSVKNIEVVPGSPVNVQVPIPARPVSGISSTVKIPSVGNSSNW